MRAYYWGSSGVNRGVGEGLAQDDGPQVGIGLPPAVPLGEADLLLRRLQHAVVVQVLLRDQRQGGAARADSGGLALGRQVRDHRLVTTGAYAHIRNPVYLGALLIWLGLGVGFASWRIVGLTVFYVLPAYLLYMRDEETMLEEAFGEQYRDYRARVPLLLPRSPWRRAGYARKDLIDEKLLRG